jgi:DNA polymerase II large subunit
MDGETSREIAASPAMHAYFQQLQQDIDVCYHLANAARKKGCDPELTVEIPQALDLAARVEQLVGPEGIAPKIRQATQKIGNRELVSLEIARMIADRKTYRFDSIEQALDQAIRTGLAILTEGVLVAPLEGIAEVRVGRNNDGTNYVDLYFSGPIRSAGGTGQAMSVLIADVVRRDLGIGRYIATQGEIERLKEEIPLYKRVQHLQYLPSVDEIDLIMRNCPICINGEGTEDEEVAGYRDLPRVGTNRLRGGACLVIAEGLCLKAPKINKHIKKMKLPGWEFLEPFVNKGVEPTKENGEIPMIPPSYKYISEVIAGRPVLCYPSRKGGFRLRYGRARTAGLASTAINPATMFLLDSFITVGTQMKTERPGKGTIGTPCDQIEGPIVLLQNGDLVQINDVKNIRNDVKKIIDLGEILIPFGEFIENNSYLPDASYVYEWWVQELQTTVGCLPLHNTPSEITAAEQTLQQKIDEDLGRHIDLRHPTPTDAFLLSERYHIPLHPSCNLFWHDLPVNDSVKLIHFIKENGKIFPEEQGTLILPSNLEIKNILIELGALHTQREGTLRLDHYAYPLIRCCGLDLKEGTIITTDRGRNPSEGETTLSFVSALAGVPIRPRAPFRIGARMGRPEKASPRKMRPPPHVLFPLGDYGGNQRLVKNAAENVTIEVEVGKRRCPKCNAITFHLICTCGTHTEVIEGKVEKQHINLSEELERAQKNVKEHLLPETIKGVIGTISKHKTPEPLEKGILRAKHNVYVFKDGTIRFDMTDAPLTHFKPKEIGVPLKRLKELGYTKDYLGNELLNEQQICELKVQDVIIADACAEYFVQVSKFIDDLLTKFYGVNRFYKVKKNQDIIGHLVVGLAPHTSAGALGRIIGFTSAQVCFMHPFFHATKRRNCYHFDHRVFLYDENHDRFLTDKIGNIVEEKILKEKSKNIDAYGTVRFDLDSATKLYAYSLNRKTGKLEKKKVKCLIKGKTNHWIKIKTSTNREIKVTPDHNILTIQEGICSVKKARDIKEGDRLPLSLKTPIETTISSVNIPKILSELNDDFLINIKLRNSRKFFKNLVKQVGRSRVIELCGIKGDLAISLSKWYSSVPLLHFKKLCENTEIWYDDLPKNTCVGLRRDHVNIPTYLTDIESLFWILGLYCAEGWSRSNSSSHQVAFRIENLELRKKLLINMKNVFGLQPYQDEGRIVYSSRLLFLLFNKIWGTGKTAYEKHVPEIIYHGNERSMINFLSAFFDGDGSISLNPDRITLYSVSQQLLEGIANLLLRINIFTRYQHTKERLPGKTVLEIYKKLGKEPARHQLFHLVVTGEDKYRFAEIIKPISNKKRNRSKKMMELQPPHVSRFIQYNGINYPAVSYSDYTFDIVKETQTEKVDDESTYCFDIEGEKVEDKAVLWHNQLLQIRCDGDEDGLMLLMDALLNFSHAYIPDKRGGKMDLPLILTTRLDPSEVDKEAHNLDTLSRYPLEFYEATLRHEHSKNLESKMGLVASRLGTELQYEQFGFTHDTDNISEGPKESLYKTLKSMMEKMNVQLSLAAKIRAVDEADVAYKVIERHFLPDILGNLRAFSKQSVRCPLCNTTYRRIPLQGVCTKCNGKLTLTVHEMSVKKYLNISKEIAEKYNLPIYARQRIALVEKSIDSTFMSDKVKNTKLTDFF